jgi:segregation and condensation protein B
VERASPAPGGSPGALDGGEVDITTSRRASVSDSRVADSAEAPRADAVDAGGGPATDQPGAHPSLPGVPADPGRGETSAPPLRTILESILLVVDEPVSEVTLAQIVERPRDEVAAALRGIAREYDDHGHGFELRNVAHGWRLYTRAETAGYVERFVLDGQQARLTQAALETLAVVAYRQPVSRSRVAAVRGVNVDGVMRTLQARRLVEEAGTDSESGAVLYRTTSYFLERLGITNLDKLPDLAPLLPDMEMLEALNDDPSSGG